MILHQTAKLKPQLSFQEYDMVASTTASSRHRLSIADSQSNYYSWFNPNNQVGEFRNYQSTAFYGYPRMFGDGCQGLQLWSANPCAAPSWSSGSPDTWLESKHTWLKQQSRCQEVWNKVDQPESARSHCQRCASILCKLRICKQSQSKMCERRRENELTLETNCFQFAVLLECACSERTTE